MACAYVVNSFAFYWANGRHFAIALSSLDSSPILDESVGWLVDSFH